MIPCPRPLTPCVPRELLILATDLPYAGIPAIIFDSGIPSCKDASTEPATEKLGA